MVATTNKFPVREIMEVVLKFKLILFAIETATYESTSLQIG